MSVAPRVLAFVLAALLSGCAGLLPPAAVMERAAAQAARDPNTWVPALGAVLFLAGDGDARLSDWAREEHPLFGSRAAARRASDHQLYVSLLGTVGSALVVPDGRAAVSRSRLLGVEAGAFAASGALTQALKYGVGRTRPDDSDALSFPSGHSSAAFTGATLTRRNLQRLGLRPAMQGTLAVGAVSLAAGTAWARVEAGAHYPSDVLAGAALGSFVAAFVNDAFLRDGGGVQIHLRPLRGGAALGIVRRFD